MTGFVNGVDAGEDQGTLSAAEWAAMTKTYDLAFAFARLGENTSWDPTFTANVAGIRAAGLRVGTYMVCDFFGGRDAKTLAQAQWKACASLGGSAGEFAPVLDLETPAPENWDAHGVTGASLVDAALAWNTTMLSECGRRPILYCYPYFMTMIARGGGNVKALADAFTLWGAGSPSYKVGPAFPTEGAAWPAFPIWPVQSAIVQWTDGKGRTPRGAPIDTNVILDEETLDLLTGRFDEPTAAA